MEQILRQSTAAVGGTFSMPTGLAIDSLTGVIDVSASTAGNYDILYTLVFGPLGQDIDGEAAQDFAGSSVALNAAGNRMIVGAYGNDGAGGTAGHARIY